MSESSYALLRSAYDPEPFRRRFRIRLGYSRASRAFIDVPAAGMQVV